MNGILQWLKQNEGKTFYTYTHLPFTYELRENGLYISRVTDTGKETFTYNNLKKAFNQKNIKSPSEFSKDIIGPSYCFALLKAYSLK